MLNPNHHEVDKNSIITNYNQLALATKLYSNINIRIPTF